MELQPVRGIAEVGCDTVAIIEAGDFLRCIVAEPIGVPRAGTACAARRTDGAEPADSAEPNLFR